MDREEAIQILSTRDAHGVLCGYTSGVTEALDTAIESLKAQTPDNYWYERGFHDGYGYNTAQKWIPCKERQPDTNDKVLVTIIENEYGDTKVYFGSYTKSIQLWMVEDRTSYFTHVEVIAWMPLPEPYKAESVEA